MVIIKFLKSAKNREQLKNLYRDLCKKYHPDLNRDRDTTEDMKQINAEYEYLVQILPKDSKEAEKQEKAKEEGSIPKHNNTVSADELKVEMELQKRIYKLVTLEGVVVEICGTWIWLSGNTKEHKEVIKSLDFKWAKNKQMWYYGTTHSHARRKYSMDEIRAMHGSQIVKDNGNTTLGNKKAKAMLG